MPSTAVWRAGRYLAGAAAAWLAATNAQAQDESYAPLLRYMQTRGPAPQQDPWTFVWLGAVLLSAIVLAHFYRRRRQRRLTTTEEQQPQAKPLSFGQRASAMGFKMGETRILRRLAERLAPRMPDNLLATSSGRDYLIADLDKRIRRRRREVEMLRTIQEKLRTGTHPLYERESERVAIDMHVWIAPKLRQQEARSPEEPEKEDIFADSQPIPGRLLDLSEGGAAVRASLSVASGDWVECWSLDSQVWTKPITATVLQAEERRAGEPPILHLQFLDPPLDELQKLIQQAQVENARRGHRVEG